jgi:hypothetical protein
MEIIGARLKIKRAEQHISEMETRISKFVDAYYDTFSENTDPHTGDLVLNFAPEQTLRCELAPVLGDAIHNLRTAIDLAWHDFLAVVAPVAVDDHTKFPVRSTLEGVIAALGRTEIAAAGPRLHELIAAQIQPYKGGKGHTIWAFHELDILDKHSVLLPIFDTTAIRMNIEDERQEITEILTVRTRGREIVSRFPPGFKLKHKGKPAFNILFDQGVPLEHEPIIPTLRSFVVTAQRIIELFETY